MAPLPEQLLYALFNFLPYAYLGIYPFFGTLRFKRGTNVCLFALFSVIDVSLFVIIDYYSANPIAFYGLAAITMIFRIIFSLLIVDAAPGRITFTLLMVKNFADCIAVFTKCLEAYVFPNTVEILYSYTNTICLLIILGPLYIPLLYFVRTYFSKTIRDRISRVMWRWLWLIPALFYSFFDYIVYYASDRSSLEVVMSPKTSIILAISFAGQIFIYFCISKLVVNTTESMILTADNQQLTMAIKQQDSLMDHIKEIRVIKHDIRHYLLTLDSYLQENNVEKAKEELRKYIKNFPSQKLIYCNNAVLNSLLVYYEDKLKMNQVEAKIMIRDIDEIQLSDQDVSVLFGNLLENACDAAISCTNTKRFVHVKSMLFQNQYIFTIENTYNNEIMTDHKGNRFSTKHDGLGIGMESAKMIVEKHNGTIQHNYGESVYCVNIILPRI